jgi:hypothetical protein
LSTTIGGTSSPQRDGGLAQAVERMMVRLDQLI